MHRSAVTRRAFQGPRELGWPLEAVGTAAEPDRFDAVLALIAGDLARAWTKRRRPRGPSSATVQRSSQRVGSSRWKP